MNPVQVAVLISAVYVVVSVVYLGYRYQDHGDRGIILAARSIFWILFLIFWLLKVIIVTLPVELIRSLRNN